MLSAFDYANYSAGHPSPHSTPSRLGVPVLNSLGVRSVIYIVSIVLGVLYTISGDRCVRLASNIVLWPSSIHLHSVLFRRGRRS